MSTQVEIQEARHLAKKFASMCSMIGGTEEKIAFMDELVNRIHRTEQQQTAGMVFSLIQGFASQKYTDGRNQYTKKVCQKVVDSFQADEYSNPFDCQSAEGLCRFPMI